MVFERLKRNEIIGDEEFNNIYPEQIQELDIKHWTPVSVAKTAAGYLTGSPGTKVLDIGSGAGKFCMIGSAITNGHFTGVEYRENLYGLSKEMAKAHNLQGVEFIHANITSINFKDYDAFYFFNSFIENMSETEVIDTNVPTYASLYGKYNQYLREQFAGMPIGTRLATYWSNSEEVPRGYVIQSTAFEGELKMWEKLY
jgi:SAM-dependent methyltransferase